MIISYSTTVTSKYYNDVIFYHKNFNVCFTVFFSILVLVLAFLLSLRFSSNTLFFISIMLESYIGWKSLKSKQKWSTYWSSIKWTKLVQFLMENMVNLRNHYQQTILAYICIALKKASCNFYWFWLDYYDEIWLTWHCFKNVSLFTRYVHYRKIKIIFLFT